MHALVCEPMQPVCHATPFFFAVTHCMSLTTYIYVYLLLTSNPQAVTQCRSLYSKMMH